MNQHNILTMLDPNRTVWDAPEYDTHKQLLQIMRNQRKLAEALAYIVQNTKDRNADLPF